MQSDFDRIMWRMLSDNLSQRAEKIAAVQAAIAAEPKPVRIPRERPPVVVLDEGPLILVETRKDLRDLNLPF